MLSPEKGSCFHVQPREGLLFPRPAQRRAPVSTSSPEGATVSKSSSERDSVPEFSLLFPPWLLTPSSPPWTLFVVLLPGIRPPPEPPPKFPPIPPSVVSTARGRTFREGGRYVTPMDCLCVFCSPWPSFPCVGCVHWIQVCLINFPRLTPYLKCSLPHVSLSGFKHLCATCVSALCYLVLEY